MRIASVKPNNLAVVEDGAFILIGDELQARGLLQDGSSMIEFITRYETLKSALPDLIASGLKIAIDHSLLRAPVERPSKIWAAAFNYRRGSSDIKNTAGRGEALRFTPEEALEMTFLKPSSAVIGPEQAILIPRGERTVYPELELASSAKKPATLRKSKL